MALVFLTPAIVFLTVLSLVLGIETNETNPLSPEHVIVSKQGISYMLWSMIYLVGGHALPDASGGRLLLAPLHPCQAIPYVEISAWFAGFLLINLALIAYYYRRGRRVWLAREL